jgi:Fe-S oxidoreductase
MSYRKTVSEKCIECRSCQRNCAFLQKYGTPKSIADAPGENHPKLPFECSLCRLCSSVCPVGIDPSCMFLEMRRNAEHFYPNHSRILNYERRGTSRRYTWYGLPKNCDTIFFPGCALSGTRPNTVIRLYEHLAKNIPSIGIVLDCCTKPSHDLGNMSRFEAMFGEMKAYLLSMGVKAVVVACPNCYRVFKDYGEDLSVTTVYEMLAQEELPESGSVSGTVTVHDSCVVRYDDSIHTAARDLVVRKGLTIEEMKHSGKKTICCGEGGSVGLISPELAHRWRSMRKEETEGRRIITYCAGCSEFLCKVTPTSHLLDLLFDPTGTLAGKVKASRSPFTYWNRIRLKSRLKKILSKNVTFRERTFTAGICR